MRQDTHAITLHILTRIHTTLIYFCILNAACTRLQSKVVGQNSYAVSHDIVIGECQSPKGLFYHSVTTILVLISTSACNLF